MKISLFLALGLSLLTAGASSVAAQSKDRDHPTPVKSNEIRGDLNGSGNEYFYSFVAGPGDLTMAVGVKSSTGKALLNFELLDGNAATPLLCCESAQANGDGQSGLNIKSVELTKRQTVILHVTVGKAGKGSYRIRLSGVNGTR